jgi:hypothetical protein
MGFCMKIDQIEDSVWEGLTTLPDDVALRMADYHGTLLETIYGLWGEFAMSYRKNESPLFDFMLDVSDDFFAATFNFLHGFFRQSFFSLRGAVELMTIGTYLHLNNESEINEWREKAGAFANACDNLGKIPTVMSLEQYLQSEEDSLFRQKNSKQGYPGGWIRRLFDELSNYSHSRLGYTNAEIWQSNGPVYSPEGIRILEMKYLETTLACFILLKIARPKFKPQNFVRQLLKNKEIVSTQVIQLTIQYLFQN